MKIIKIEVGPSGGHENQTSNVRVVIPDGWALVPDDMETENFPYGDIEVENIDGVLTVTRWTPGSLPEPEEDKQISKYATYEELASSIRNGVNSI